MDGIDRMETRVCLHACVCVCEDFVTQKSSYPKLKPTRGPRDLYCDEHPSVNSKTFANEAPLSPARILPSSRRTLALHGGHAGCRQI